MYILSYLTWFFGSCILDSIYNDDRIIIFLDGWLFPKDKEKKPTHFLLYFSYIPDMTELPELLHFRFTYSVYLVSEATQLDFKMYNK